MGIDPTDIAFRIEERFGLKIDRDEVWAVFFGTAGMIHQYLVAKLRGEHRELPRLEPLFKEVYGAIKRISGWWNFSTPHDLNRLFSPTTRSEKWQALEQALGIPLPRLERLEGEEFAVIPQQCNSLTALTHWIAEHHPERVEWFPINCRRTGKMASQQWSPEEVWEMLRESISDALDVNCEDVTYDARMVEDLGMN